MAFKFSPKAQNISAEDIATELEKARQQTKDAEAANTQAIAALLEQSIQETPKVKKIEYVKPEACIERIRVIFDDSSSMSGEYIKDARDGVIEFMRNCIPNQTAVGIHLMNNVAFDMDTNLPELSKKVLQISASGGTPMFETWKNAQMAQITATRYVMFSDGEPNNTTQKEACIAQAIKDKTPCDTVLLSHNPQAQDTRMYQLLKEIADRTGGIFMVFDRNKMDFRTGFKYLAPTNRLALSAPGMKEAVQEGRVK